MLPSHQHPSYRGGPDNARERLRRKEAEPKRRLQRANPVDTTKRGQTRRAFQAQEKKAADLLPNGRLTPGSGNGWAPSKKGDASGDVFRMECKVRAKPGAKSVSIHRADLDKIDAEARRMHNVSVFMFGYEDGYDRVSFLPDTAKTLMRIAYLVKNSRYDEAQDLAEHLA